MEGGHGNSQLAFVQNGRRPQLQGERPRLLRARGRDGRAVVVEGGGRRVVACGAEGAGGVRVGRGRVRTQGRRRHAVGHGGALRGHGVAGYAARVHVGGLGVQRVVGGRAGAVQSSRVDAPGPPRALPCGHLLTHARPRSRNDNTGWRRQRQQQHRNNSYKLAPTLTRSSGFAGVSV